MNDRSPPLLTYEAFLAYAQTHERRFEYVDGQILDRESPATSIKISPQRS